MSESHTSLPLPPAMTSISQTVTFTWRHPGSHRVQLAGTFNDWTPQDMTKDSEADAWTLTLENVPFGTHEFKFVLDGHNWVHDEAQEARANEMGSFNNVLVVRRPSASSAGIAANIEVERKFEVPADFRTLLPAAGFELVKEFEEEVLADKYYDTEAYALIQANHWLRQRNGDWELKYPLPGSREGEKTTLYHETSNLQDILGKLRLLPAFADLAESATLAELCEKGTLAVFADVETRRLTYKKAEVNVVIDFTDWGYRVGEIEIVVDDRSKVDEAVDKIEGLAKELGEFDLLTLFV